MFPNSGLDIAGLPDVDDLLAVLPVPSNTAPAPAISMYGLVTNYLNRPKWWVLFTINIRI